MNDELPNFETREKSNPTSRTLTSLELIDLIYKGKSILQDERFASYEKGGVFKYFDLSQLINVLSRSNKFYSVIE